MTLFNNDLGSVCSIGRNQNGGGDMSAIGADNLILFAAVIDAGSFARAAERLGLPKSTLSRRISNLESQLGQRLVLRTTRKLSLTEFGERVLEHSRRLQEESDAVKSLAAHEQDQPRGLLRVALPPDFVDLDLTSLILQYTARYPEVRLELDLSPRRVDLVAERFDVAIRAAEKLPDDSTLVARQLLDMTVQLYASPAYLQRYGMPEHPDALESHVCLPLISSNGEKQPWVLHRHGERWQGTPRGLVSSNSPGLQRELVLNGMGIAALSDPFVRTAVSQGLMQCVLPDWHLPKIRLWSVTTGRKLLPSRTLAFVSLLQERLAG